MVLVPISFAAAAEFVERHHRHSIRPIGHKFSIGLASDGEIIGVVIAGRPVNRNLDDGWTIEITRCCVLGNYKNACSKLYGAAIRVISELGYAKVITYTLISESGSSVKGAGFLKRGFVKGRSWNTKGRPRIDKHDLNDRYFWQKDIRQ